MSPAGVLSIIGALSAIVAFLRRPARPRRVEAQFALALISWAALWFAAASPFARAGMTSLPLHMIGHIIVMFLVPMGLIISGSGRSTWWLVGAPTRRRVLRWWYVGRRWRAPRWLAHPVTATLALNAVMVSSHVPRVFDALMEHTWAMDWIMEPAFLLSGLFFFHFLVSARPRRVRTRLRYQMLMVLFTMLEMLVLAMSMSIFTRSSWYSVMNPSPGSTVMPGMSMRASTLAKAFSNQQLAAAILWICGDFWAVPCLVVMVRRAATRDGSLLDALERQSAHLSDSRS